MGHPEEPLIAVTAHHGTAKFLEASACTTGLSVTDILDRVFRSAPLSEATDVQHLMTNVHAETLLTLDRLDRVLRLANPGSQTVVRGKFIGYRRADPRPSPTAKATRSDLFACLVPRTSLIRVVLPLQASEHADVAGARDLSGTGHHGVGDLAVDVKSPTDVDRLMADFARWLGPCH